MWTSFFVTALVIAFLLYVPGFLVMRSLCFDRPASFAVSPVFSISLLVVFGIIYKSFGIFTEWWMVVIPVFALAAVARAVSHCMERRFSWIAVQDRQTDWIAIAAYLFVGVTIAGLFFVKDLNGPASFAQLYDNASHLNTIHSIVENGNYSVLYSTSYSWEEVSSGIAPTLSVGAFYPEAWHIVTALASAITGVSSAVAENASLFVFIGVVLPVSTSLLMFKMFTERLIVLIGAVVTLAFSAFPWGFLTFGPLYSNLAAFALVPVAVCSIACVFSCDSSRKDRAKWAFAFVIACFALAVLQPNALFSMIVLAAPLCAARLMTLLLKAGIKRSYSGLVCALSVFALILVWTVAWRLPAFNNTVTYPWTPFEGFLQALVGGLNLSLRAYPPQWLLGCAVLVGAVWSFCRKNHRAFTVSYLISLVMFVVCACSDGAIRSYLTGFWYNDAYRIAALVAIASVPLASMGIFCSIKIIAWCANRLGASQSAIRVLGVCSVILGMLCVYGPVSLMDNPGAEPAFGVVSNKLNWLSDESVRRYTVEESAFVDKTMDLVKDDPGGIVNIPYDGSVFAYGANAANVMFRSYAMAGGDSEKPESVLVRNRLNDIANNESVRNAVVALNAKYVLQLDANGVGAASSSLDDGLADEEMYRGILAINESTPGFTLLASEGDMRLYRIDD